MERIKYLNIFLLAFVIISCGVPKQTMQKIVSKEKLMNDFPMDYCNLFPSETFELWDSDFDKYNKFLTSDIMRTQMGLSFNDKGVQTWWCPNSARPHVQLDTATRIADTKQIIGDWRVTCNRRISFTDSAVYSEKKIYRDSKVIYNEKGADVFIEISEQKFKTYGTDSLNGKYKRMTKNYEIVNNRFLLLYGLFKSASIISFVGMDKEGHLIINSYSVEERKIKGTYITYESIMTQLILRKV